MEGIHCGAGVALCCCARLVFLPRGVDRKPDLGYNAPNQQLFEYRIVRVLGWGPLASST